MKITLVGSENSKYPTFLTQDVGSFAPNIRLFRLPGVKQCEVTREQVVAIMVTELPYRLRLGSYWRAELDQERHVEVACLNRFALPRHKKYRVESLPTIAERSTLRTRVALLAFDVELSDGEMTQIRNLREFDDTLHAHELLRSESPAQPTFIPNGFELFQHMQRFIELYNKHCPPEYTRNVIRPVWLRDYFEGHVAFVILLIHPDGLVPDTVLKTVLRAPNARKNERDISISLERDVSKGNRKRLAKALVDDDALLADRLWFMASEHLTEGNQETAVVLAVAALESAMAAFVHARLEPMLGHKLAQKLLRMEGAYTLIEALPKLHFRQRNMPSDETTKSVLTAIEARNALMHGALDRTGSPKFYQKGNLTAEIHACRTLMQLFQREAVT